MPFHCVSIAIRLIERCILAMMVITFVQIICNLFCHYHFHVLEQTRVVGYHLFKSFRGE